MPKNSERGDGLKGKLSQAQIDSIEVGPPFAKTKINPHGNDPAAAPNKQANAHTRIADATETQAVAQTRQADAIDRLADHAGRFVDHVGRLVDVVVDVLSTDVSSKRTIDAAPPTPRLPEPKPPRNTSHEK